MAVYTSYYAKAKDLRWKFACISISRKTPGWFYTDGEIQELFPSWDIIMGSKNGRLSWEQYTALYKQQLNQVDKQKVWNHLHKVEEVTGKDILLLCYERPEANCHRHIVADWLGYGVREYTGGTE